LARVFRIRRVGKRAVGFSIQHSSVIDASEAAGDVTKILFFMIWKRDNIFIRDIWIFGMTFFAKI